MEEIVNLHRPGLHLRLPPSLSTCAVSLAGWLAGYSENIEWKACSIQPVSQSVTWGKGIWMGRAAWLQALIPGCYDRASGWEIWRVSSTGLFLHLPTLSWQVLIQPYFKHILYCIYIYMCVCQHRYIPGLFHKVIVEQIKKKKEAIFLGIQFPRCPFVWLYKILMKGTASSVVCLWVPFFWNIPPGIVLCIACVCVCLCISGRVYLGWVNVVEHYYGRAVVVQHQSPEILHRVWQRVLGHYERRRLLVTLQEREGTRGIKRQVGETATKYIMHSSA